MSIVVPAIETVTFLLICVGGAVSSLSKSERAELEAEEYAQRFGSRAEFEQL